MPPPPGALAAVAGDPIGVLDARQKPLSAMQATMAGVREAAVRLNEVLAPAQRQAFAKALFMDRPGFPPPGGPGGPGGFGPGGFGPGGFGSGSFGPGPHGMHPPLPPG